MKQATKKQADTFFKIVKKMGESHIQLLQIKGQCLRCGEVFGEPEKEFKILRNPITGETRRSIFCNTCRPIKLAEFKKKMEELKNVG